MRNKEIITLVSPPLPCGISLLVNILLELNVKTTIKIPEFQTDHNTKIWVENGTQSYYVHEAEYTKLLPILKRKKTFEFKENIEVLWTHALTNFGEKVIFIHRDLRDAVLSYYKRNYGPKDISFDEFLRKPDRWPHHFPDFSFLPPAETCVEFFYYWERAVGRDNLLNVKFSNIKLNSYEEVIKILNFIGISRTKEQIEQAISNSSIELIDRTDTNHAHSGAVNEWITAFTQEQKDYFNTSFFYKYMRKIENNEI
jgi:hypothetical protein